MACVTAVIEALLLVFWVVMGPLLLLLVLAWGCIWMEQARDALATWKDSLPFSLNQRVARRHAKERRQLGY